MEATKLLCQRCGAEWEPKVDHPRRCPFCYSPYWNRPKIPKTYEELVIFMRKYGVELEVG